MGYRAYPEYKKARLEWLGNLPKHWECLRLRLLSTRLIHESSQSDSFSAA